jgi:hypothetical protein
MACASPGTGSAGCCAEPRGHPGRAGLLIRGLPVDDHPAIGEVRPLLTERGCTDEGGVRLRTLADVVAHRGASRQVGLPNSTEVWVRHPAARSIRSASVRLR